MGRTLSTRTCGLCDLPIGLKWLVSAAGEVFCAKHEDLPSCRLCAAPTLRDDGCCRRCGKDLVGDRAAAQRAMPEVRTGLHAIGIRLRQPVRVELVAPTTMASLARALHAGSTGPVNGLTEYTGNRVVRVMVQAGLPVVEFGAVVAHEAMHAWLTQRRFRIAEKPVQEGLCQLVAHGWLRRQADPLAALIRSAIERDPDPDYGEGFRLVRAAARRTGFRALLRTVRATGRLP